MQESKNYKVMIQRIKKVLDSELDRWEQVVYLIALPFGFAASAFIGYIIGTL